MIKGWGEFAGGYKFKFPKIKNKSGNSNNCYIRTHKTCIEEVMVFEVI